MSHPQTRRWSNEPRRATTVNRSHDGLVWTGIALFAVGFWAVVAWGVAGVLARLASVPVALLQLADMVVASR